MQAVNSRVVGLVALGPRRHSSRKESEVDSSPHRLPTRSDRRVAYQGTDYVGDWGLPTRIVHANLAALMLDLQRELQAYYVLLDGDSHEAV